MQQRASAIPGRREADGEPPHLVQERCQVPQLDPLAQLGLLVRGGQKAKGHHLRHRAGEEGGDNGANRQCADQMEGHTQERLI